MTKTRAPSRLTRATAVSPTPGRSRLAEARPKPIRPAATTAPVASQPPSIPTNQLPPTLASRLSAQNLRVVSRSAYVAQDTALWKQKLQSYRTQILIILALIIGLPIIYLMFVFPLLVDITGRRNAAAFQPSVQVINPQTPQLNAPASYTTKNTLTLTGYALPGTFVQVLLDDEPQAAVEVGVSGEFTATLELQEGANEITAYSFDEQGTQSSQSRAYTIVLDTQAPEINLLSPEPGSEFVGRSQQTISIQGETEPGAQILVGTTAGTADENGVFSVNYLLSEGDNLLTISATDHAGNSDKLVISVTYSP
ncbi:hypothetical protein IJJ12_01960 [bacterium]|nr:hypothetical protein [bacterium]